jgi:hypothetical protein
MPINLTCECGKKLAVKEDMAGKKVKCPGCASILAVPALSDTAAPDEAIEDAPLPSRKEASPPKKSKTLLYVGVGAGVLVLGACCCGSIGIGGLLVYLNANPEKAIIGKWVADNDASSTAKDLKFHNNFPGLIEFRSNGTLVNTSPVAPIISGKWKVLPSKTSDSIRIEMVENDGTGAKQLDIKVIDNNHLRITAVDRSAEVALKRAP